MWVAVAGRGPPDAARNEARGSGSVTVRPVQLAALS